MTKKIAVVGSGGWGIAMSVMLDKMGHEITMWSRFQKEVDELSTARESEKLLSGVKISDAIKITSDLGAINGCDMVIIAVPSHAIREVAKSLKGLLNKDQILINIAKGLEDSSGLRLSEVIKEETGHSNFCALTGPSHAEEVGRGLATTVVAASDSREVAMAVQDAVMNPMFRIYTTSDVIGAELGGALKNVIALCAGISDGMGYGDNTKAALMTRGITEMARLGVKMGARRETFAGLSGIGDLIVTCTSMHSRNRRAGVLIGQGKSVEEALKEVNMVVEGYKTAKGANLLRKKFNVEMPIVEEAYQVLYDGKNPTDAMRDLMGREKKHEIEDIWLDD